MPKWDILRSELNALDHRLMPPASTNLAVQDGAMVSVSLEDAIGIHAYIILAHGAIEEHLEELFIRRAADIKLAGHLTPSRIVGAASVAWIKQGDVPSYRSRTLESILAAGRSAMLRAARSNHGIKEKNIQGLAEHAGVEWVDFEKHCVASFVQLDTLGGKRGSVAHLSASSASALEVIDPEQARQWVVDALAAVRSIENYLTAPFAENIDDGEAQKSPS